MMKYSSILVVLLAAAFIYGCQPKEREDSITDQPLVTGGDVQTEPVESDDKIVSEEPDRPQPQTEDKPVSNPPDETPTEVKPEPIVEEKQQPEEIPEPKIDPKPQPKDDPKTEKPEPKAEKPAFYEHCTHIFTTYVDKHGNVDYLKLRRKRAELIRAVRSFNEVESKKYIFWSKQEKMAMWINAYNIFTMMVVIENYPIQSKWYILKYPKNSIMQIHGVDTWEKEYFKVMGIEYNLREIEREILLQKFKDMRVCFALTYDTRGGAFLRNEPYYPEKLEQQLDEQTKRFLKSPKGMKIDKNNKKIYLSAIFDWYRKEFADKYGDMKKFRERSTQNRAYLNFIANYVAPDNIRCFESDDYTVEFIKYDWLLNEQSQK